MTDDEVKKKLTIGINNFMRNEQWLLNHNLSEQSMTHKLAEYLQTIFSEYNVDCEYNGNVERPDGRKKIDLLKRRLKEEGLLRERDLDILEKEFVERAVFPDIIIHHRGTNEDNLLIIEVKKSNSPIDREKYDYLKLEAFTSNQNGNDLHYQIGAFIKFIIGQAIIGYELKYFKEGLELPI